MALAGNQFRSPALISDSSQLPISVVPGDPIASGFLGHLHTRGTHNLKQAHIRENNKHIFKKD